MDSNPFAILTFIAAPAVLTNASSLLTMSTSNRFGRNVDRARALIKLLDAYRLLGNAATPEQRAEDAMNRRLLEWVELRTALLMRAMSLLYFAIGSFAAGSMTSLLGAIVATTQHPIALWATLTLAVGTGVAGLGGLVWGGWLLTVESRLALKTIREEMNFHRGRFIQSI